MSAAEAAPEQIATLCIEFLDTEPLIWREVEIPTAITLKGLHDVVQAGVGWDDQHLWALKLGRQRYGGPLPGDNWGGAPTLRAEKVVLGEVLKPRKTLFGYLYDFGDSWEHRLTITNVRQGEAGAVYPGYVAGEHAAPPEDCGGVPGFYAALEALGEPGHPEHETISDWPDRPQRARTEARRGPHRLTPPRPQAHRVESAAALTTYVAAQQRLRYPCDPLRT